MNKIKKYQCYIDKEDIDKLSGFNVSNVRSVDNEISFYTNKENYDALSNLVEIRGREINYSKLRSLLKKHLITIIGLFIISLALINQSSSIVGVKFTNTDTYNEEILKYLEKYYNKVGPYRYLNEDLNTINFDLRKTFYHYEWIGIRKSGSYLYLDIKEIKNKNYDLDPRPGSYYAKYDGIVKRYHLEKGIVLVQEEQYVVKGEKLISGEIPYHNQEVEYIKAIGYVIAEVLQYREFVIPIENLETSRTGKIYKISRIAIFDLNLGRVKNPYREFDKEEQTSFNLLNFIKKKDIYYYEKKSIKNIYSEEDAIDYAKSLVERDFRLNKVNPYEKIIFNELVKIELIDNNYHVKLIVKTYQNIAEFIPDKISE